MKRIFLFSLFSLTFFTVTLTYGAEYVARKTPKAFIPYPAYEFQTVLDGTKITHDFIIQNKGDATLNIVKVKTT